MQDALAHEGAAFTEGEDKPLLVSTSSRWRVRRHTTAPSPRTYSATCRRHSTKPQGNGTDTVDKAQLMFEKVVADGSADILVD